MMVWMNLDRANIKNKRFNLVISLVGLYILVRYGNINFEHLGDILAEKNWYKAEMIIFFLLEAWAIVNHDLIRA
jgi:hypothetical protein